MTVKAKEETRHGHRIQEASGFISTVGFLPLTAAVILALCLTSNLGCSSPSRQSEGTASRMDAPVKMPDRANMEPKSGESRMVDPAVQSELERMEAEKRATLLTDAESAIQETRNALAALDKGDKQAALAALERATGKLDLVVARDPAMALAPVSVSTTMLDLYATPDTVKAVVTAARDNLIIGQVQQARRLVQDLASEADIHVAEIPLATYPPAIRAITPLVDAGRIEEAKAALYAALNTLVIETYVVPLPKIRAEAMLAVADTLAARSDRKDVDKAKLNGLINGARRELQLAEVLGYGTKDSYKPLYAQLDEIQKKTDSGQSGRGIFDKFRHSLKSFKFSS
jgi:hypothetical protein